MSVFTSALCICRHGSVGHVCVQCVCSGLHMVSGVINALLGQHSTAVCVLTAAHADPRPLQSAA